MKTIYIVRHGEYENPNKVLPNRLKGFPLTKKGKEQLNSVAAILQKKDIKVIFSSPILRTKQSARILQSKLHKPLIFSKSIIECSSPVQGMNESIVKEIEKYGDTFKLPLHKNNEGETVSQVYDRMKRLLNRILLHESYSNAVIVSHGDPIMVLTLIESGHMVDDTHSIRSYHSFLPYILKGGLIKMVYENNKFSSLQNIIV